MDSWNEESEEDKGESRCRVENDLMENGSSVRVNECILVKPPVSVLMLRTARRNTLLDREDITLRLMESSSLV